MNKMKFAINGYGRIGRNIIRAYFESDSHPDLECVAINDLGDANTLVHLTKYDSTHGKFKKEVGLDGNNLIIDNHSIALLSERDPNSLPWKKLGVDLVMECTGLFTSKEKSMAHINAGAKKVLISAPGGKDIDVTVVYGVNHDEIKKSDVIISNASCTTNCLASFCKPLHDTIGIDNGLMTTIHSYTNDQVLCDVYHSDLRRARAVAPSMIPTKTGAANAVGLVIPSLNGKLDGFSVRVPTMNVSLTDLSFIAKRNTSVSEVNDIIKEAAKTSNGNALTYTEEPLVSIDYNHNPSSAIFDGTMTRVSGRQIKACAWYDNEWGFSSRMLDVSSHINSIGI